MRLLLLMLVLGEALMLGMPRFAKAMGTVVYQVDVTVLLRDATGRAMPNVRLQGWHYDQASQYAVTDAAGRTRLRYGHTKGSLDRGGTTELSVRLRFLPASPGAISPFLPLYYRFEVRGGQAGCSYSVFVGDYDYWFGEQWSGTFHSPSAGKPQVLSRAESELPGDKTVRAVAPRRPGIYLDNPKRWVDGDPLPGVDAFECMVEVMPGENRVIQLTLVLTHQGMVKVGTR